MRTTLFLAFALILTGVPNAALAGDPYADVNAMRIAFAHVRSATAIEHFSGGDVATVQYSSPNRYHITTPNEQIVLSGNVEYAKRSGGQWVPSNRGAEHQAMLSAVWQVAGPTAIDLHKLYTITALGTKTVAGATVRGYRLHDTDGAYDETLWIGPNNLPVAARIEMPDQAVDIRYDYNGAILIATPNMAP